MSEIINKPYYYWDWNPTFDSYIYIADSYNFSTGWDNRDFTSYNVKKCKIYNTNGYIYTVESPPYGPSGSSDPEEIFDNMVYFEFDNPDNGRMIGKDRKQFIIVSGSGDVRITAKDNQRPWEWAGIHTKTITNISNPLFSWGEYPDWRVELTGTEDIVPSENVLLVYNDLSPASVDLKDYYTGARTGLKGLNILGINCDSGQFNEVTTTGNYVRNIRDPIWNYIRTTDKPIKYCILMYGIPTYMTGDVAGEGLGKIWTDQYVNVAGETFDQNITGTVQTDLMYSLYFTSGYARHPNYDTPSHLRGSYDKNVGYTQTPFQSGKYLNYNMTNRATRPFNFGQDFATTFLVTHLFADSPADVSGYIHKITGGGIVDGVYLKGSGSNTGILAINASSPNYRTDLYEYFPRLASGFYSGLNDTLISESHSNWTGRLSGVTGTSTDLEAYITGYNINTFLSWGIHTAHANGTGDTDDWATIQYTSNIKLEGDNNWFCMGANESYGGQNRSVNYGGATNKSYWFSAPYKQFASNAYYGTDYSNVPVGWMGHVAEPGGHNWLDGSNFINFWLSGDPFIHCAYGGSAGSLGQYGKLVIGDPFIKCF